MSMLQGYRLIDLTRLLPGPLATLHFADHGADVIKVEDMKRGDYTREHMAFGVSMSHLYHALNRGKRSIAVDLTTDEGKDIFRKLIETADIVVENFRPGVMDGLSLGYDDLKRIKKDIIYCAISAYGADSPERDKAAHDINICALSGVSDQMGAKGAAPAMSNFQIADIAGGALSAVNAILTALLHRHRTNEGSYLDISMAGSLFAMNVLPYSTMQTFNNAPERGNDMLTGSLPCYGYYETKDNGWIAVGALEPQFWQGFCALINRPDLIAHQHSTEEESRRSVITVFKSKTLAEWKELLQGADCCVSPVLPYEEAIAHPHLQKHYLITLDDSEDGAMRQPFNRFCPHQTEPTQPAPRHGEHSKSLLESLGFAAPNIENFYKTNVVK